MGSEITRISDQIKNDMPYLREKYGVSEIGIFGSRLRGDAAIDSDLDVLVEFSRTVDYFEFLELEEHLSILLGVNVDLVEKKALRPNIGKSILSEVVRL